MSTTEQPATDHQHQGTESATVRFYLAPLRGVTDHIFRNTFELHFGKFDFLLAPFVPTVKGAVVNPRVLRDLTPEQNDTARLVPQILGNSGPDILRLGNTLADLGYRTVNWNLGCPHPVVSRKKRGAGLLPHPDLIASVLDTVVPRLRCPLSLKVRLGLDTPDQLYRLMPLLNEYPLNALIIHPRTAKQQYSGSVDLDEFERARAVSRHPVVYNGDIVSLAVFNSLRARLAGVDAWMIGRGVVGDPFLLEELRIGAPVHRDPARLRAFHDDLYERYRGKIAGTKPVLGKMKELWAYFAHRFIGNERLLKRVQKSQTYQDYETAVDRVFEAMGPEVPGTQAEDR